MPQGGRQVAERGGGAALPHPDKPARGPTAGCRQAPIDVANAFDHGRDVVLMLVHRGVEPGKQWLDGIDRPDRAYVWS